jgi:hypothetical protein
VLERLKLKPACPLLDSEDGNDRRWNKDIQYFIEFQYNICLWKYPLFKIKKSYSSLLSLIFRDRHVSWNITIITSLPCSNQSSDSLEMKPKIRNVIMWFLHTRGSYRRKCPQCNIALIILRRIICLV